MRYRELGGAGTRASVVGQGTWYMEREPEDSLRALRHGLELGLNHIDTATLYGDGKVEEIVGRAIEGRRAEVFLVSKVLPQRASREGTVRECEASLRRLGTDHLDGYLLHWAGSHPLSETVAAFEELQSSGKIRSWGVSNFDEEELAETLELSPDVACDQVLYHVKERAIEHAVLPFCDENDVAVVAYSALGSGDFPGEDEPGGRMLAEIAREHGATARQVALAFLLHRAAFVLVKASKVEHVEENAGAADLELTDEERERIERAFPRSEKPRRLPML